MTNLQTYANQAELAWAAYASLNLGANEDRAFRTAGVELVEAKATTLATRYTVQAIHNDPLTGAYAFLFFDTQTYQQTLAIRGTEGATDVLADLHLLVGIPAWMSLQYQSLVSKIEQWQVQGLIGPQTTITGHSLGGYLAAAFTRSSKVITINSIAPCAVSIRLELKNASKVSRAARCIYMPNRPLARMDTAQSAHKFIVIECAQGLNCE